jgi:hypothetical protein
MCLKSGLFLKGIVARLLQRMASKMILRIAEQAARRLTRPDAKHGGLTDFT